MAWTVTPQANEEGQVVGFGAEQQNEGYWKGNTQDYREINGETHHIFENVEVNEDTDYEGLNDYYDNLASLYPDLQGALVWASQNLPRETIEEYNAALDADDFNRINQTLEYIYNQYDGGLTEEVEEDTNDEVDETLSEVEVEEYQQIFEDFSNREPQGQEASDQWMSLVAQAHQEGNEPLAAVAAASAAFHAGEVTAQEAFQWVTENYNIRDLERIYRHFENA